jgi:tryptophan synthase alpha chain
MGVTGIRESVSTAASSLVQRIRATTQLPVCVGIGISNAAQVAVFADGLPWRWMSSVAGDADADSACGIFNQAGLAAMDDSNIATHSSTAMRYVRI